MQLAPIVEIIDGLKRPSTTLITVCSPKLVIAISAHCSFVLWRTNSPIMGTKLRGILNFARCNGLPFKVSLERLAKVKI